MRGGIPLSRVVLLCVTVLLAVIIVSLILTASPLFIIILCIITVLIVFVVTFRSFIDPDRLRARQSERTMRIAAQTLPFMRQGLNPESAQAVCEILLPATLANAVAITNREFIMGYAGAEHSNHPAGTPIVTKATLQALKDGQIKVITSKDGRGLSAKGFSLQALIIVPLTLHEEPGGVLVFIYRSSRKIDETQKAIAQGFGILLEMQLQLADLEQQRELASQMRLQALQAQINPHFLFNTINTIAALIRTNPAQARILLREFAAFYRHTLEGSLDLITLEQEYFQTLRYFGFEVARFGSEKLSIEREFTSGLDEILVPAFILQPLVENAVGHAMRDDQPLRIDVHASVINGIVKIVVTDNGIGMSAEDKQHLLDPDREHMGIALRNVDERLRAYFGIYAGLAVQSELGKGTSVILALGPYDQLRVVHND